MRTLLFLPLLLSLVANLKAGETPRSEKHSPAQRKAGAKDANPRVVRARDSKLDKELEYLVYDLGNGVELKLVKVAAKGQSFAVGSSAKEQDEVTTKYFDGKRPASLDFEVEQKVTLTDDFYIGQCEVTRGQFRRFVEDAGYTTETEASDGGYGWNEELKKFEGRDRKYSWKNYGVSSETDEHPVTNITRNDARKFCEWLAKKGDGEVRLPGEAEWEFACRAGSSGRFSFGDEDHNLGLDVNGGPDMPAHVARLAARLPELRIVINHAANLKIDGKEPPQKWREGMAAAAKHPKVFCKVSALVEQTEAKPAPGDVEYYRPVLDALWSHFSEERLIYGSNWPVSAERAPLETVVGIVRDYFMKKGERAAVRFSHTNSQTAYAWRKR